ncbi:MAG: Lytic transglycosylase catalytic, partial [Frankiales bacterium]|nr:Lytic transglycosylase catalytic [Frankiales bacterium]
TSMTAEQLAALRSIAGVETVALLDAGAVSLAGAPTRLLGVDPSSFRSFTPQDTAASDELWQSVARGELAASFSLVRARQLPLGGSVPLAGEGGAARDGRIGAHAAFGLPGVEVVTDQPTARRLGVVPQSAALLSAPAAQVADLAQAVKAVLGPQASVDVLRPAVSRPAAGRPKSYRDLYIDSARYCPGLSWTVLAAIGQVESGHGRELGPSSAGALGPMQFLPSTWAAYGLDGDGDGTADIMNPHDAVPSAAGYLCRSGAGRGPDGLYDAIFAYNHADWYVRKVLDIAAQYR